MLISFDANYRVSLFVNNKEEFIKCCKEFIVDSNIVKLSEEEAKLISGIEDIKEASQYIVNLGCENLMVTLGKEGTLLSNREKQILIKTK